MTGLPPIEPYPMPTGDELPDNIASWTLQPERVVLLIHDMQRYFLRAFAADRSPRVDLVRHVAALLDRCRALGVPVAYTMQPGSMTAEQRGLLADFWGPGMRSEPHDRQVVEPLTPAPDDWVFTKWRYSAFFRSDLLQRMRAADRDQLLLCGVYAHVGVIATAVEAFTNDIRTFLVADAVADFSARHHRDTLRYAAQRCAMVLPTATVLEQLTTATGGRPADPVPVGGEPVEGGPVAERVPS